MNAKFCNIGIAIWILLVVPAGFAESFSGRPTETEMDDLMALGIETGHGVYERCYATQYSTDPDYDVSPPSFIGTNGWYLSTSVMQALDSKAKALVPYYMNTNVVMFSVTGLWAQLEIGDHTNQFTGTPAIGTNPPTYGDYPWWIYKEALEERYKVLQVLKFTPGEIGVISGYFWEAKQGFNDNDGSGWSTDSWETAKSEALENYDSSTVDTNPPSRYFNTGVDFQKLTYLERYATNFSLKAAGIIARRMSFMFYVPSITEPFTNEVARLQYVGLVKVKAYHPLWETHVTTTRIFEEFDSELIENNYITVISQSVSASTPFYGQSSWIGSLSTPETWPPEPSGDGNPRIYLLGYGGKIPPYGDSIASFLYQEWDFQYCTDE